MKHPVFISFLYMFRATLCPTSGEITIYATLGICHSVWMTVWSAGWFQPADSHPYRVTNTKSRIDTVIAPDDGHRVARNLQGKEINILRKTVHQVGFIYKIV